MRLGRYVPVFCLTIVAATAVSALADALSSGLVSAQAPIGGLLTFTSVVLVLWLVLDLQPGVRGLAKAALALLLAGAAIWLVVVWPSFWASLGLDDCVTNCIRPEHEAARLDMAQGKWAIAAANICAAMLVLAALLPRSRNGA
jgi:hypothetical protein